MTPTPVPAAEVVVDGGYELAEGGRWTDGRYVYVDILSGRLLELRDATGPAQLARLEVPLGAVAPVGDRPDAWIAAAGTGIALLAADGTLQWLDRPEDRTPVPSRMNDGVADPDGTVVRVLDGLTIVNGPALTTEGTTLYVADTAAGTILRCRVDPVSGDLTGDPETFVRPRDGDGSPDGMTVDEEGCLWVAMWGAGAVRRYHPDGHLLHTLTVPAPHRSGERRPAPGGAPASARTVRLRVVTGDRHVECGPRHGRGPRERWVRPGAVRRSRIPRTGWCRRAG
jgi:sugar lactone lactonase YvrE